MFLSAKDGKLNDQRLNPGYQAASRAGFIVNGLLIIWNIIRNSIRKNLTFRISITKIQRPV